MASIKDVAQKAGVGVGTVSRVINGSGYVAADTRKKIEQAISDLEYTPNELARNLFRNRTGIIGVLIPDLDHPFFSAFARETEVALYKRGYKAMICNTVGSSNRERDYLNMLDRNMVDGIITGAHTLHWKEYVNRKRTIVALDQDFGPEIPMVGSDHAYGGKLAAEIMLKNNCKRIVHISGIAPNVAANDRHIIFEETLKKHGVEVLDLTMEWNLFDHQSYWDAAAEAMEKYPDVDGVFAGINVMTGTFSLIVKGRKIENGRETDAFCQVTIAGNFFDMLGQIQGIANDYISTYPDCASVIAPSVYVGELAVSGI